MDDEVDDTPSALSEQESEDRKIALIKEQLIAEGLEIVGEEEIVEELSPENEVTIFSMAETLPNEKRKKEKKKKLSTKKSKKKKSKKSIDFSPEELESIEDAVEVTIATLKRKQMKKLLQGKQIEISLKLERNQ